MTPRQVVAAYYRAFNHGEWPGMLALLSPTVVHDLNQGPRERGRAAFAKFLARMEASYQEQLRDIHLFQGAAGRVAAEYVVDGKYLRTDRGLPKARGQKYSLPGGAFFVVKRGRITRVTNYYNLPNWIAQVRGR